MAVDAPTLTMGQIRMFGELSDHTSIAVLHVSNLSPAILPGDAIVK